VSRLDVNYDWSFLEYAEDDDVLVVPDKGYNLNDVFDILPINGVLRPGQVEHVEFSFKARKHFFSFSTIALCEVEGGPEYEIKLEGDSGVIEYQLSAEEIDFGEVPFNE